MDKETARARATACLAIEGHHITDEDTALFEEMDALDLPYDDRPAFIIQRHREKYGNI